MWKGYIIRLPKKSVTNVLTTLDLASLAEEYKKRAGDALVYAVPEPRPCSIMIPMGYNTNLNVVSEILLERLPDYCKVPYWG